jgi:arabinose-5-phosphate isomerase
MARPAMPDPAAALIAAGARVLRTEAEALRDLSEGLGGSFAAAVEAMLAARGRVIVSGMGKSGHVARKIAATFASTGTPAQFVHPGEASHGDLGMITAGDVVLLLSNSGETPELADLIRYTRRHAIPLIGVAMAEGSTLLRQADIAVLLPRASEACPNGLAPTTSTTMTMALGDAMAVALMERRGFSPENFRAFHPGGTLGARLATVGDLMHRGAAMPLVGPDTPMTEVLLVISSKGFGVAGVVDAGGALAGVITDGDLRRRMDGLLARTASGVMTASPKTIDAGALAAEALGLMQRLKITTLFAVEAGSRRPLGILHIHDCLRAGLG